MKHSDTIAKFSAAFVAAQALVEGAKKASDNPGFKQGGKASKYADLSSVWDACKEAVTKHKIGVIQSPGLVIDGNMHMETLLLHESGEWLSGELSIPLQKADAQAYGSCVTYARRYALGAMMGVCPEDDDGNAASAPRHQKAELLDASLTMIDAIEACETKAALESWLAKNGDAARASKDKQALVDKYNQRLAAVDAMDRVAA